MPEYTYSVILSESEVRYLRNIFARGRISLYEKWFCVTFTRFNINLTLRNPAKFYPLRPKYSYKRNPEFHLVICNRFPCKLFQQIFLPDVNIFTNDLFGNCEPKSWRLYGLMLSSSSSSSAPFFPTIYNRRIRSPASLLITFLFVLYPTFFLTQHFWLLSDYPRMVLIFLCVYDYKTSWLFWCECFQNACYVLEKCGLDSIFILEERGEWMRKCCELCFQLLIHVMKILIWEA